MHLETYPNPRLLNTRAQPTPHKIEKLGRPFEQGTNLSGGEVAPIGNVPLEFHSLPNTS